MERDEEAVEPSVVLGLGESANVVAVDHRSFSGMGFGLVLRSDKTAELNVFAHDGLLMNRSAHARPRWIRRHRPSRGCPLRVLWFVWERGAPRSLREKRSRGCPLRCQAPATDASPSWRTPDDCDGADA